jgi:DNA-binding GntR family transcriptional regulator
MNYMPTRTEVIAASLRARIEAGEFPPGSKLPSEAELTGAHKASRTTVRNAIARLVKAGLVSSHPGIGTIVRKDRRFVLDFSKLEAPAPEDDDSGDDPFAAEIRRQGGTPREEVELRIEIVPPTQIAHVPGDLGGTAFVPRFVGEKLQLDEGAQVVVRRRSRFDGQDLLLVSDSYFPFHVAQGTPLMSPQPVHIRSGILRSLGKPYVRVRDEHNARETTEAEAARLGTHVGAPLDEIIRTGYAADGEPLRCMVNLALGARIVVVYELEL